MLLIDAQRCLLNAQLLAFEGGIPDGRLLLVLLLASTTTISVSLEFETQSNISLLLSCKFDTPDGEFRRLQLHELSVRHVRFEAARLNRRASGRVLVVERGEMATIGPMTPTALSSLRCCALGVLGGWLLVLLSAVIWNREMLLGGTHLSWFEVAKGDRRGILALCA